jgi:hypothetical protein
VRRLLVLLLLGRRPATCVVVGVIPTRLRLLLLLLLRRPALTHRRAGVGRVEVHAGAGVPRGMVVLVLVLLLRVRHRLHRVRVGALVVVLGVAVQGRRAPHHHGGVPLRVVVAASVALVVRATHRRRAERGAHG